MKIDKLQEQFDKKKKELEKIEKQLKEEKEKKTTEEREWVRVPGTDYEVTKNVIYKGKSYKEIMQLKKSEEELLTLKQIGEICEHPELVKELKMDSSGTNDDFFFKQPFPQNEARGYVAWFYADSGYADLSCWYYPDDYNSSLGVRFAKKILRSKK